MSNDFSNDLIEYAVKNINHAFGQLDDLITEDNKDGIIKLINDNTTYITDDFIYDIALSDKQELIERMAEKGLVVIDVADHDNFKNIIKEIFSNYNSKKEMTRIQRIKTMMKS